MANSPASNVFQVLDSANTPLVRADSGLSTITWAKQIEEDVVATTGGVSLSPATAGIATACQAYFYNSGTVNVTITQSPQNLLLMPGDTGFMPALGTGAITFTSASSTASVYCLILGV